MFIYLENGIASKQRPLGGIHSNPVTSTMVKFGALVIIIVNNYCCSLFSLETDWECYPYSLFVCMCKSAKPYFSIAKSMTNLIFIQCTIIKLLDEFHNNWTGENDNSSTKYDIKHQLLIFQNV